MSSEQKQFVYELTRLVPEPDRPCSLWTYPMKRSDSRATPTTAAFCGIVKEFLSEQEAYVWMLNHFMNQEPKPFTGTASDLKYLCCGARGATYFAQRPQILRKPYALRNGWHAELNLGNSQKIRNLGKLASVAQLKYGVDWRWDALNRHTNTPIDVEALLAELDQFTRSA